MADAIPLSSPDGTVRAYACGICLNVRDPGFALGGHPEPADIAESAELSRSDADECCRCRSCGRVDGTIPLGSVCVECEPAEAQRWAELAELEPEHNTSELLTLIADMTPAAFEAFMISARDAAKRVKEVERNG